MSPGPRPVGGAEAIVGVVLLALVGSGGLALVLFVVVAVAVGPTSKERSHSAVQLLTPIGLVVAGSALLVGSIWVIVRILRAWRLTRDAARVGSGSGS